MQPEKRNYKKTLKDSSHLVFLSLGSNLDHPEKHIRQAFQDLQKIPDTQFIQQSPLYVTTPVGFKDQPDFINACVALNTTLSPQVLLEKLLDIEKKHGRNRNNEIRWHPRTLDVDILLYGSLIVNNAILSIPHPRMLERLFVIQPLSDIAPSLVLPNGVIIMELLTELRNAGNSIMPFEEGRCCINRKEQE